MLWSGPFGRTERLVDCGTRTGSLWRSATLYPTPHPRDNTGACAPGCTQLITTDAVSVYQWTDAATAQRFCKPELGACDQVGVFVLSYAGSEQALTSGEARKAYADKVRSMVGAT